MADFTSYQRRMNMRIRHLEILKRYTGMRVAIDFTPLGAGGRVQGRHEIEGLLVGVAASPTLLVKNVVVILLDKPDEEGRNLYLINANHVNDVRRKTFTAVDIAAMLKEIAEESDIEPVDNPPAPS
jgi:hypothetical protein